MNANPAPIPCALRKPSQPSESQSPDASEGTPASAPLLGVVNSPNGATVGLSPSQDVNEDSGEREKQTPNVSLASSINSARSLPLSIQDASNNTDDKVHRVRIEPERTGWARIHDLVREVDKTRIGDNKEDIDTLLVFVSLYITSFCIPS